MGESLDNFPMCTSFTGASGLQIEVPHDLTNATVFLLTQFNWDIIKSIKFEPNKYFQHVIAEKTAEKRSLGLSVSSDVHFNF